MAVQNYFNLKISIIFLFILRVGNFGNTNQLEKYFKYILARFKLDMVELGGTARNWVDLGGTRRNWMDLGGTGRNWVDLGGTG